MPPNIVKIFTVCLASPKRYKAMAIYNGETLVITHVIALTGMFGSWKSALIKEIEEKKAQGFIILIEEKTDYVAQYGTKYLLEDMNTELDDRRSNYYDALDWYFALAATDNLVIDSEYQRFAFHASSEGGKIEKAQNDKGQTVYKVNWQDFHGGYRAVLLCVVAACYEPLSERYLEAMFQMDERAREINHPAHRFKALIESVTLERGRELEKIREEMEQ